MKRRLVAMIAVLVVALLLVVVAIPMLQVPKKEGKVESNLVISEVMYDPFGPDAGHEWIELFNPGPGDEDLAGWKVSNRSGTLYTLPRIVMPPISYLVIVLGLETEDSGLSDLMHVQYANLTNAVLSNEGDEVALSGGELNENTIVDFVCWCSDGDFNPGKAYDVAVAAHSWTAGDFFNGGFPSGNSMVAGFSLARDRFQTETNTSQDWARNGGRDAYFATPGEANAAPYFTTEDGIKLVQTKANQFFMQWGADVLNASHAVLVQSQTWNLSDVSALHRFTVEIGGLEFNFSGEGRYRWWRVDDALWRDNISLVLVSSESVPVMWLNYSRSYEDAGLVQTIKELTECLEFSFDEVGETPEEPPLNVTPTVLVKERYVSNCTTSVTQTGLNHYLVVTNDTRSLGYRGERQWLNFSKDYVIHSDAEIEAWTRLSMTSDKREPLGVSTHYSMITDVGWHRVNDFGEVNLTYFAYNLTYGDARYSNLGDGHFTADRVSESHYVIDWRVHLVREGVEPSSTLDVGGTGDLMIIPRNGENLYKGQFTAIGQTDPVRYCIDGYESVIGGGICAIAGGLIGSLFVGVGAVIGGGVGAAACGAAGYAIEEATEPDTTKPTIEFELGDQGSNKDYGWIKVKITITDDNELAKVKYGSRSSNQGKSWSSTTDPSGKTYTISKTFHNAKCVEDWRTVTIKAWDEAGNMAVKSQQIRVPPRDCTPNVKETKPANKTCCVPVNSTITVVFCKPMNTTSAESAIHVTPFTGYEVQWTDENSTIALQPTSDLMPFTNYTVLITTEAKSCAERPLLENYSFWFITEDPYGPVINVTFLPDTPTVSIPVLSVVGNIMDNVAIIAHGYSIDNSMGFENITFPGPPVPYQSIDWLINLALGENDIVVWAVDVYGNYKEETRTVDFLP